MVLVKVYGRLSDILGFREKELEFDGSLRDLLERLGIGEIEGINIAVNHELERDLSTRVRGEDLIAIFPSFSGGSAGIVRERITPELFLEAGYGDVGALVAFLGIVRRESDGGRVDKIFYDCYPEIAERELIRIREEAIRKFGLRDALIIHRVGEVPAGDISLFVLTKSAHRKEAFEAAEWIVDEVKRSVAIWKKEIFSDGRERWV
jgi:molybdopterin synthase catalytic subunit